MSEQDKAMKQAKKFKKLKINKGKKRGDQFENHSLKMK